MNVDVGGDEWCDNVWQQSPRGNKIDSKMNIWIANKRKCTQEILNYSAK